MYPSLHSDDCFLPCVIALFLILCDVVSHFWLTFHKLFGFYENLQKTLNYSHTLRCFLSFPLKLLPSDLKEFGSFWVGFCEGWDTGVEAQSSTHNYRVFPAPVLKEAVVSERVFRWCAEESDALTKWLYFCASSITGFSQDYFASLKILGLYFQIQWKYHWNFYAELTADHFCSMVVYTVLLMLLHAQRVFKSSCTSFNFFDIW